MAIAFGIAVGKSLESIRLFFKSEFEITRLISRFSRLHFTDVNYSGRSAGSGQTHQCVRVAYSVQRSGHDCRIATGGCTVRRYTNVLDSVFRCRRHVWAVGYFQFRCTGHEEVTRLGQSISLFTNHFGHFLFRFRKPEEAPVHVEVLTPIDEEPSEDLADDDQPITMVPKIVQTAPSPSTEQPTITVNGSGNHKDASKEVPQMESVL